jgi:hypothetical protein
MILSEYYFSDAAQDKLRQAARELAHYFDKPKNLSQLATVLQCRKTYLAFARKLDIIQGKNKKINKARKSIKLSRSGFILI